VCQGQSFFSRGRKSVTHQVRHFDSNYLTAVAKAANSVCLDSCRGVACAAHGRSSHVRSAGTARLRHQNAPELKLRQLAPLVKPSPASARIHWVRRARDLQAASA